MGSKPRKGEHFRHAYVPESSPEDYKQVSDADKHAGRVRRRTEDLSEGLRLDRDVLREVWD
jgi:hypothetical protein